MEPFGTRERQWRDAPSPNRVGEHANAVDLDEQRRVAQPRYAKTGFWSPPPMLDRIHHGQVAGRNASLATTQELAHRRSLHALLEPRRDGIRVDEDAAVEPR